MGGQSGLCLLWDFFEVAVVGQRVLAVVDLLLSAQQHRFVRLHVVRVAPEARRAAKIQVRRRSNSGQNNNDGKRVVVIGAPSGGFRRSLSFAASRVQYSPPVAERERSLRNNNNNNNREEEFKKKRERNNAVLLPLHVSVDVPPHVFVVLHLAAPVSLASVEAGNGPGALGRREAAKNIILEFHNCNMMNRTGQNINPTLGRWSTRVNSNVSYLASYSSVCTDRYFIPVRGKVMVFTSSTRRRFDHLWCASLSQWANRYSYCYTWVLS